MNLDSVKAWQNFFVNKELPRLYKSKTKGLLARYFSLFATEGFSDHVAIDDCDVAQFAGAILGPDSPLRDKDPNFILSDNIQRPDPPIVLNSCRKYQGVKLVTCVPNGSEPRDGYTIYHCGELIRRDAPADSLKMSFSPEAIETERAIGTLAIIIGPEEFFQLEDLARRLDEYPKAKRRESMPIPAPTDLSPYKGRLSLVTYLRSLTAGLISAKKAAQAARTKIDDRDFIYDLGKYVPPDQKKSNTWGPLLDIVRSLKDMSWPEACLQILRRLNVTVTAEELVDDYKSHKQDDTMSDEEFVLSMHENSKGLSAVLGRKEALLYAAANMNDTRIKKRLVKQIKENRITTFNDMFAEVAELNEDFVGRPTGSNLSDQSKAQTRSSSIPYTTPEQFTPEPCQEYVYDQTTNQTFPVFYNEAGGYRQSGPPPKPLTNKVTCHSNTGIISRISFVMLDHPRLVSSHHTYW